MNSLSCLGCMALLLMACQERAPGSTPRATSVDTAFGPVADQGTTLIRSAPSDTAPASKPHVPRTDGHYDQHATPGLHYLMRFFPQGQVALVAGGVGPRGVAPLAGRLLAGAPDSAGTVHRVPFRMRGDSLFFQTTNKKGSIAYAGAVSSSDTLHFLKTSAITGKQALVTFVFRPDLPLKQ